MSDHTPTPAPSEVAETTAGEREVEATCKVTSFGVPTDDHVTICGASATEEWLDLTGQWVPVCDSHGRGRGVPNDRLRPLPAEPEAGEVGALAKVPRHVWISDSVCIDPSRVVSVKIIRAPLPRYAGQFLGGRRDVVLTLDTGKEHTVTAVDEDNRRRDFESHEPAEQRDRVEAAARAWVDDLLRAASVWPD